MAKRQEQQLRNFVETLALAFDGRPMVSVNKDKSIDAEVLIRLTDREDLKTKIIEVEEYIREHRLRARLPETAFISVGMRFEPRQRTIRGRRVKRHSPEFDKVSGLNQLFTSYYGKKHLPTADAVAIIIAKKLREGRWSKNFEQILLRIHWNPRGKQPPRPRAPKQLRLRRK